MAKGRRRVPPVIPRRDDVSGPVLPVPRPPEAGRFPRGPIPGHEPSPVGTGTGTTTVSLPRRRPAANVGRARVPITLDPPKGSVSPPGRPAPPVGRVDPGPSEPEADPNRAGANKAGADRTLSDRARALSERRKAAAGQGEKSSGTNRERSRAEHPAGGRRTEVFLPWYTAGPGDSLRSVAARLGLPVQVLAGVNGAAGQPQLVPGQRVFLPLPGSPPTGSPPTDGPPTDRADPALHGSAGDGTRGGLGARGKVLTHVLGRGESLESVAEQHGV
ncbi:MAG: LysM domain, partial [Actinomycetota bacterium]|nr:LysM domain [Actinomycetota bacterium]